LQGNLGSLLEDFLKIGGVAGEPRFPVRRLLKNMRGSLLEDFLKIGGVAGEPRFPAFILLQNE
jgi:hypothetical protein